MGRLHLAPVSAPAPQILLHLRHGGPRVRQLRARARLKGDDAVQPQEAGAEDRLFRDADPALHGSRGGAVGILHIEQDVQGKGHRAGYVPAARDGAAKVPRKATDHRLPGVCVPSSQLIVCLVLL